MKLFDKTETIGKSLIQHGPNNDRVYLMKLASEDKVEIVNTLYNLAILKRYTKIFVKVPESSANVFLENNFKEEARIPRFYNGKEDGCFMSLYFSAKRSFVARKTKKLIQSIVSAASEPYKLEHLQLDSAYTIQLLTEEHVSELSHLYKKVFKVYPFPIFDEKYLLETMNDHIKYFGVFKGGNLVAASSAEMDPTGENAEMTDFATHPDHLGRKLSMFLLQAMEDDMKSSGIKTVYTIARATSYGMNKTFGRMGYSFGGTLINNTLIGESIENMNVWYKGLA